MTNSPHATCSTRTRLSNKISVCRTCSQAIESKQRILSTSLDIETINACVKKAFGSVIRLKVCIACIPCSPQEMTCVRKQPLCHLMWRRRFRREHQGHWLRESTSKHQNAKKCWSYMHKRGQYVKACNVILDLCVYEICTLAPVELVDVCIATAFGHARDDYGIPRIFSRILHCSDSLYMFRACCHVTCSVQMFLYPPFQAGSR